MKRAEQLGHRRPADPSFLILMKERDAMPTVIFGLP